jgi:hypothetical protein
MDKLTCEEEERALNFYALDFEEFLRENFQLGTNEHMLASPLLPFPCHMRRLALAVPRDPG